jgi:hypothetical protein
MRTGWPFFTLIQRNASSSWLALSSGAGSLADATISHIVRMAIYPSSKKLKKG